MRSTTAPLLRFCAACLGFALSICTPVSVHADPVLGTKRVMVLRVYFHDYAATSGTRRRRSRASSATSTRSGSTPRTARSTRPRRLRPVPAARQPRAYVDDFSGGDLSNGTKFWKVLNDAIDKAPTMAGPWTGPTWTP